MADENPIPAAAPAPAPAAKPAAEKPKATKKAAEGTVVAVHSITYGKGQHAPAGSFFVPSSDAERDELAAAGAIRELTDVEARVAAELASSDDNPLG
jgi:hypothetical protein